MLKDRVIDGTSCSFPSDFIRQNRSGRAMCVEGICKVRIISLSLLLNFMAQQSFVWVFKEKTQ